MELLKGHNWMLWKRRMLAVLQDLGLEKYIAKDAKAPKAADEDNPTQDEKEASKRWKEGDAKACTHIELSIGNSEMIHISGTDSAREMWEQLTTVKEFKGRLGVLVTRWTLYWMMAEEGFDMVEHILKLRKLQEELHLMENKVMDKDFVMILITSLPESWDQYTSTYLGLSSNMPTLKSHKLVAILKKIGDDAGEMMTQPLGWLCKPNFRKVTRVLTQRRWRRGNVSIVGRKDTSRKIVGLKVEGMKGREP